MQTVSIKINGKEVQARQEQTILEVVLEHNLDNIPTLCYSPELQPYGSCFLCVVDVKGRRSLVPACTTRIADKMEVETRNERVIQSRRTALELLLSNHYADCISPCSLGCPAHVDAQGYIALTAMGLYKEAVQLIRQTNPFPSICGRVCVRKCEVVCRRKDIEEAVGINNIKRYITDYPGVYDDVPPRLADTGKKVAIVGGGPSGLTATYYLGLLGHNVTVYEALPMPGGMLRYGIPEYRLPKKILDREIEYIVRATGCKIETGKRVGYHLSMEDLRKQFDAIYVAAGASGSNKMGVKGEKETKGVVLGIDFLREKTDDPSPVQGTVMVIGGGNTAMDAARVSWRLGAEKVIVLYRRTKAEMPADPQEVEACIREGIQIIELAAPIGIIADDKQTLKALRCIRMLLGEPDSSGRRRPIPQDGSEFEIPCNLVITAIGQTTILEGIVNLDKGMAQTKWGTIVCDKETLATSIPGIFAGGDVADDGPTVVIDAIADGQKAARSIHNYLTGQKLEKESVAVRKEIFAKPTRNEFGNIPESPRHKVEEIDVEERIHNFKEVAIGYDHDDTMHECTRCLSCGCFAATDCLLRKYATEYNVDMTRFSGYIRKPRVDDRHPYLIYDPNKCILCTRCIRTCTNVLGTSALGLVNRGIKTEVRPAMNDPLAQTNCVSCGNCVDSCPTGALTPKLPFAGRSNLPVEKIQTHCGFCSLGCPITVKKYSDHHYFIESSGKPGEYICRFGRFGNELFLRQNRITKPFIRQNGRLEETDWNTAYRNIVSRIRHIAQKYGPESVAIFVSPESTNEEAYLAAKIAREGIGTNNIASLSILSSGANTSAMDDSFGFTTSTSDRSVLKEADLIICNNTALERDNLILNIATMEAIQNHNAKAIVCDSASDALNKMAHLVLDPIRGRSALLWNSVIQVLLDNHFFDRSQIASLPGGEIFLGDTFDYRPEVLESRTGVENAKVKSAADMISKARHIVFIHSEDRTIDRSSGDLPTLANFMFLLQSKGIQCDLLLPTSFANFAGINLAGVNPAFMPGLAPLTRPIPGAQTYTDLKVMLHEHSLKAVFSIGEDIMRHTNISNYFTGLEFLAAMDSGYTDTTSFADVVLPGSTYLETFGTRCNFEGRLTSFSVAIQPPSGKNGFEVLSEIAGAFSVANLPQSVISIQKEIENLLQAHLAEKTIYLWNAGQKHRWDGKARLVVAKTETTPIKACPPLTRMAEYKHEAKTIGMDHFKVVAGQPVSL